MRRPHKKSRLGCNSCKHHRVKCDEERPECHNCIRRNVKCSFLFTTPGATAVPASQTSKDGPKVKIPKLTPPHVSQPYPSPSTRLQPSSILDLQSLELFHHYISMTHITLASPGSISLWRITIPQIAFSHTFLMNGLLALSALHLASLQPHRASALHISASISKQAALPSFRKSVAEGKNEDIHAVFAFSWILVPFVLAFSEGDDERSKIPNFDGENPHWFFAIRGLLVLFGNNWRELAKGPFSPLLSQSSGPYTHESNPDDSQLAKVHQLLAPKDQASAEEERDLAVCRVALDKLRVVSALPYAPCKTLPSISSVYLWTGIVTDEYLQLVHARKPEALVVLAYYCVLLKKSNDIWYLRGVGENMLDAISNQLDEKWKPWITWAIQQQAG